MKLSKNKDLEKVIPVLRGSEFDLLKQSIKEFGQIKPLDVMADGTIIDGYHRYQACIDLGITPTFVVLDKITTIEQAKEYSFEINFARRQLISFVKAEWAYNTIDKKVREDAAKRQIGKVTLDLGQGSDIIGTKIGISGATYERAIRMIIADKNGELRSGLIEKLRRGEVSIDTAYNIAFGDKKAIDQSFKGKMFAVRYTLFEGTEEERIAQAEEWFRVHDGHYVGRSFSGIVNPNTVKKSDEVRED